MRKMSLFTQIPQLPPDPIFGLAAAFVADPRKDKINLSIGTYGDEMGKVPLLSSVKEAEQLLISEKKNKQYLPIEGDPTFIQLSLELIFDATLPSKHIAAAQTVGGTSALRLGGEILSKLICKHIYIPDPTWANHKQTFEAAGLTVHTYPYVAKDTHALAFQEMCEAFKKMPAKSCILFHACCHNPTGIDPTWEMWRQLSALMKERSLIPFFDVAYQGFGEGIEEDVQALRLFAEEGHEMLIAYSFAKNFGLYGERAGLFACVTHDKETVAPLESQMRTLIRGNYSNPPIHGAKIVATILGNEPLKAVWREDVNAMRHRLLSMRKAFASALKANSKKGDFSFIEEQKGLFSTLGLTPKAIDLLREEKAIYLPANGRINIAGLNSNNIARVAEALTK